ncbi:MAG: outer membrane lipoprotein-sorting protein, partial [Gammaproteobacteria bacterium]|nr:outer membrane lipoprotein-sorting protein [Gammaproteobacteria bacterium]
MKTKILTLVLALTSTLTYAAPSAFEVMQAVDNRYIGDTRTQSGVLTLIDKNKNQKTRELVEVSRKINADDQSVTQVISPAELTGTSFLSYNYDDVQSQDESWIYLPQLAKVKRLAVSDRKGYFLGSDFTYNDLAGMEISLFDYQFDTKRSSEKEWVIDAYPSKTDTQKAIDETGYTRVTYWVDKDKKLVTKAQFWLEDGDRVKYFRASNIVQKDGIWTPLKLQMILTRNR